MRTLDTRPYRPALHCAVQVLTESPVVAPYVPQAHSPSHVAAVRTVAEVP